MSAPRSHLEAGQLFGTDGHGTYWQEQELAVVDRSPACTPMTAVERLSSAPVQSLADGSVWRIGESS